MRICMITSTPKAAKMRQNVALQTHTVVCTMRKLGNISVSMVIQYDLAIPTHAAFFSSKGIMCAHCPYAMYQLGGCNSTCGPGQNENTQFKRSTEVKYTPF